MESDQEPDNQLDQLARSVLAAAVEVHGQLGPGFVESVYEEALAVELKLQAVTFARQVSVPVTCKGCAVGQGRLDFFCRSACFGTESDRDCLAGS